MHFQTFIFFSPGFGGFSEKIVLKKYIYIYVCMYINKCKFHIYDIYILCIIHVCIYIELSD